jgi:hypothetical protein
MTMVRQHLTRMQIPPSDMDQYIVMMQKDVRLALAELIFNMDETGFSD